MASLKEYIEAGLKRGVSQEEITKTLMAKGYSKKEIDSLFVQPNKENLNKPTSENSQPKEEVNFFDKIGMLFGKPIYFFKTVRDNNIGKSLGLYAIVAVIFAVLSSLFSTLRYGSNLYGYSPMSNIPIIFISGIFSFAFLFIISGAINLFVKMFGGKGNYVDTFNAIAYGLIPAAILSVIPIINFVTWIYAIILITFGLSEYHQISRGKACSAIIIPIAIIFGILIGFIFLAFSGF